MGSHFQRILFILTLISTTLLSGTSNSLADGADDYYRAIRKAGNVDAMTRKKIKSETLDAARIREVNALAKENEEHTKKINSMPAPKPSEQLVRETKMYHEGKVYSPEKPTGTPTPEQLKKQEKLLSIQDKNKKPETVSKPTKKPTASDTKTDSGPAAIKVDSNLPDEIDFTDDTKKADTQKAPAPSQK